jgi:hypothetical protein
VCPVRIAVVIPTLDEAASLEAAIASARAVAGDAVLFLHADTRLPAGWAAAVRGVARVRR